MTDVTLQVPVADAVDWEDWLTDSLSVLAVDAGMGYDGGEEVDGWEEHLFLSADAARVRTAAETVLRDHGERRQVSVVSADQVRVEPGSGTARDWLKVRTTADPYGRAIKELVGLLNARTDLRRWLAGSGIGQVLVQESPVRRARVYTETSPSGDLFMVVPVDLSIYDKDDGRRVSRGVARTAAKRNLRTVLDHLARTVGSPLPRVDELDEHDPPTPASPAAAAAPAATAAGEAAAPE